MLSLQNRLVIQLHMYFSIFFFYGQLLLELSRFSVKAVGQKCK